MRILLVDDDQVDRMAVKRALASHGSNIELVEVENTSDAENELEKDCFDLILLDQNLTGENGLDWLKRLYKSSHAETAVIIISAEEDDAFASRCIEAGAQDFLPKHEINAGRMKRALAQANVRFRLEMELRHSYEQLRGMAQQDTLTRLANRFFFEESVRTSIARAERNNERIALMVMDLDDFKIINDSHGHDIGDEVLREVAERLRKATRDSDMLFRLGGDEFATLVHTDKDHAGVSRLAERIRATLIEPIRVNSLQVKTSASIGVATYPDNGNTLEELYKSADIAMYRAKKDGRNQLCFYSSDLHEQVMRRAQVEHELTEAIAAGQMQLFYQPQIACATESLESVEALVRWRHPADGLKVPGCFLSIAEQNGQINHLGNWVLNEACEFGATLNRHMATPVSMAVNISAVQLHNRRLVAEILETLGKSGLPPDLLELELTETALLEHPENAREIFSDLADEGIRIVLDDFGVGYSSLSHIKNFPIDTLKVDKAFLWGALDSERNMRLLCAVVSMAKAMHLKVVVEGVETEEQYKLCIDLGVDRMQGYYIARPLPLRKLMSTYGTRQLDKNQSIATADPGLKNQDFLA